MTNAIKGVGDNRERKQLLAVTDPFFRYPPTPGAVLDPYVDALETHIRAAPANWYWLYKRWKYPKPLYTG